VAIAAAIDSHAKRVSEAGFIKASLRQAGAGPSPSPAATGRRASKFQPAAAGCGACLQV
jgi:hypothetical protein